ncbi:unnamed protein product [Cuscuta epithymum]|uniref:Secreted protein n=1 Tax=Cuscuta epithymum TaxID=186058 RepID=A0AAV0FG21_9ASTE|nr:unnamed protein product [Cuscuta epithymum]
MWETKQVGGCMHLLQIWAWSRISMVRPSALQVIQHGHLPYGRNALPGSISSAVRYKARHSECSFAGYWSSRISFQHSNRCLGDVGGHTT